ncbi:hypothetical protein MRB53_008440 [Persea americana]|uniref:Uncharacterized protein n=1 Tax=Persea americana TaxID=3435 RepID=A0ACC2MLP0_PERAE|nr:hypothetical protein MRB53_008440 [Persea americana]
MSFVSATSWLKRSCRMQNPVLVFLPVSGKARQGMETKSAISTLPEEREREERGKRASENAIFCSVRTLSPERGFHTTNTTSSCRLCLGHLYWTHAILLRVTARLGDRWRIIVNNQSCHDGN